MSICGAAKAVNGEALKQALAGAISQFSQRVADINEMNVFPVPDGDTGINMYHTLQRAYSEIAPLENADIAEVARRFAYGALMGARGNSGTILSQLLKGFSEQLQTADTLCAPEFARACKRAAQFAYDAVTNPVEGTILTVAREAAETLELHLDNSANDSQNDNPKDSLGLAEALDILLRAARESLRRTPELLPILKESGVVDAGGLGLLTFLEGLAAANGNDDWTGDAQAPAAASPSAARDPSDDSAFGYDVQFLMLGKGLSVAQVRQDLRQMGWSLLVVGDPSIIKVHIHVHNPALPLDYAIQSGATLDDIVVENMTLQYQRRARQAPSSAPPKHQKPAAYGTIAVAQGEGLRSVFADLGCDAVIQGGQGRNPSVEDFLAAIDSVKASQIFILPNNRNIVLTAKQAVATIEKRRVAVLPTTSVVKGISALIALRSFEDSREVSSHGSDDGSGDGYEKDSQGNNDENNDEYSGGNSEKMNPAFGEMQAAAQQVRSLEITRATRDTNLQGMTICRGDFLAISDGQVLAAGRKLEPLMRAAIAKVVSAEHELATVYYGDKVQEREAREMIERLSFFFPDLELELIFGGQDLYPYLIGLE